MLVETTQRLCSSRMAL